MQKRNWNCGAGVALAVVLLVGGFALADPLSWIGLPGSGPFTITAVVQPGESGGHVLTIRGGTWIEKEDLSIDFGDDGYLTAFGDVICSYERQNDFSVTADYAFVGESWRCDVVVRDLMTAEVLYSANDVDVGETAPFECLAVAQAVHYLAAD